MRGVDPSEAANYITKSEEFLEMAKLAVQNAKYNSAATNAVHSAISALEALTTSYRGRRGSDYHAEVLSLVRGIFPPQEYGEIKRQLTSIINKKNAAGYQPDLMGLKDAQDSVMWAERIVGKAKKKLEP